MHKMYALGVCLGSIESSRAPSGEETQALVDYLTGRFASERCERSVEVIKRRIVGVSPPQLPLLLDLLDALVNEVGDAFLWALISQELPIPLLRIRGHKALVLEYLHAWVTPMSEDCFEALIDQILPEEPPFPPTVPPLLKSLYVQGQLALRVAGALPYFMLSFIHVATLGILLIEELCEAVRKNSTKAQSSELAESHEKMSAQLHEFMMTLRTKADYLGKLDQQDIFSHRTVIEDLHRTIRSSPFFALGHLVQDMAFHRALKSGLEALERGTYQEDDRNFRTQEGKRDVCVLKGKKSSRFGLRPGTALFRLVCWAKSVNITTTLVKMFCVRKMGTKE